MKPYETCGFLLGFFFSRCQLSKTLDFAVTLYIQRMRMYRKRNGQVFWYYM
jgi:hypothetical protein